MVKKPLTYNVHVCMYSMYVHYIHLHVYVLVQIDEVLKDKEKGEVMVSHVEQLLLAMSMHVSLYIYMYLYRLMRY